jgi:hypothetical protein
MESNTVFSAFAGHDLLAWGPLQSTLLAAKERQDLGEERPILFFDESTGAQFDMNLAGSAQDVLGRLVQHPQFASTAGCGHRNGPGRPKLGVVCREVSLLPRHWEWLQQQPQGSSAALRRLVDAARKNDPAAATLRQASDATYRFMSALAGDLPGFEEAARALFKGDAARFDALIQAWPAGIRERLMAMRPVAQPREMAGAEK